MKDKTEPDKTFDEGNMYILLFSSRYVIHVPSFYILNLLLFFFVFFCFFLFFYQYIIAHTFKNIKTLSPGTNILGVPGKKQKEIPN